MRAPRRLSALKPALDQLVADFERATHVDDPVRLLHRYPRVADREVVAFVAAGLAFGRVRSVIHSIETMLAVLGPAPAAFVRQFCVADDAARLAHIVHRWTRGEDLVALVLVLQRMLQDAGTLEACFARGLPPGAQDVTHALGEFSSAARAVDVRPAYRRLPARPGVHYFFPHPGAGSACKRLNLFLRWMVRRDAVDPGGWTAVAPSQLIVPLDVHVVRVGQCLGLTRLVSPGWRMAAEITASLRALDADDPVRYDFALCHLGMLGQCGFNRPERDGACPLRGWCRPRADRRRASRRPSARR